jgi:phosphoribosylamine--glycine ligase
MKILVVGSGGREHAIVWAFNKSEIVKKIYCANGNAGISKIATCVDISPYNISELADFAEENKIDLTFVGGETSLDLGIVDEFEKRDLAIIGPNKKAAKLESSKAFAKDFMKEYQIPTANYETVSSEGEAIQIMESGRFGNKTRPLVVKADGLAAGKGVIIAKNRNEAILAVKDLISGNLIEKEAARKIVLEECLEGKEISLILFSDGKNFSLMPPTRDHKRIGEGDTGPNTGGMGTINDPNLLSKKEKKIIIEKIIKPTLKGCLERGFPFRGILFLGLMMTEKGPQVLEYNVRFGDPETQAILVNLETDLFEICQAINTQTLDNLLIEWNGGASACIILAAENYPGKPRKGDIIKGLEEAEKHENVKIFHSGTNMDFNNNYITAGGRVLAVTAVASNLSNALHRAYKAVNEINWEGMQYRRDIGK